MLNLVLQNGRQKATAVQRCRKRVLPTAADRVAAMHHTTSYLVKKYIARLYLPLLLWAMDHISLSPRLCMSIGQHVFQLLRPSSQPSNSVPIRCRYWLRCCLASVNAACFSFSPLPMSCVPVLISPVSHRGPRPDVGSDSEISLSNDLTAYDRCAHRGIAARRSHAVLQPTLPPPSDCGHTAFQGRRSSHTSCCS